VDVSETAPEPSGGGKRIFGLKPKTLLIIAGITLAGAIGFILWRRSQASSAAAATTADTGTSTDVDYSGELSAIQTEIEALQQEDAPSGSSGTPAGGGGSGTGSSSGGGQTPPSNAGAPPVTPKAPPASPVHTVTGSPAGGGPPAPAAKKKTPAPPAPSGVKAVKVAPTAIEVAWAKTPGATGYLARVTYQGKLVKSQSTSTPAITISGLTPDHTYGVHVAARNAGGTSPEGDLSVKTSK
jgi:hypothetical protein